jgi:hypothetical protein
MGPARHTATSDLELSVRLRSFKESSFRVSAETGPQSVGKGPGPLRQDLPFLAPITQKRLERWNLARGKLWHSVSSCFCPPARPGGVMGAPPAGRSRFISLGGPLPESLRGVRAPPGASATARLLPDRRDPA